MEVLRAFSTPEDDPGPQSVFWGPVHQVQGRGQLSVSWSQNSFARVHVYGETHMTTTTTTTTQGTFPKRALVFVTCFVPSCWRQIELPTRQEPRGGGSDDRDSGFGTNV